MIEQLNKLGVIVLYPIYLGDYMTEWEGERSVYHLLAYILSLFDSCSI